MYSPAFALERLKVLLCLFYKSVFGMTRQRTLRLQVIHLINLSNDLAIHTTLLLTQCAKSDSSELFSIFSLIQAIPLLEKHVQQDLVPF